MTVRQWLVFLSVGRLFVFMLQDNPHTKKALGQVGHCDLCLGFWVYLGMSLAGRTWVSLLDEPSVDTVATASLSTVLMHLLRIGLMMRLLPTTGD